MLKSIYFQNSTCYLEYSQEVKELLKNTKKSIKIDLQFQRTFVSKHSLAFYELCLCRLKDHQPRSLSVKVLRVSLGLLPKEYQNFKEFNRSVLKKALAEVNQKTSLKVQAHYLQQGKTIQAIKLFIGLTKKETMKTSSKASQVLKL